MAIGEAVREKRILAGVKKAPAPAVQDAGKKSTAGVKAPDPVPAPSNPTPDK